MFSNIWCLDSVVDETFVILCYNVDVSTSGYIINGIERKRVLIVVGSGI